MQNQQPLVRSVVAILRTPQGAAIAALLTAGLIYLLVDHTAHVLGVLPYAFFLLCPVLHLLMMRGMHGGHGSHDGHDPRSRDDPTTHDRQP